MIADRGAPLRFCLILSEHLTNHYIGPLVRGAAHAAAALGYALIVYTPLDIDLSRRSLPLADLPLLPPSVDGYLLPGLAADDLVEYCRRSGAPLLMYAGKRPGIPSLGPNNQEAARAAVAHVIAHGRRRIAFLRGLDGNAEAQERYAGYRAALADAGLPYDPALVATGNFRLGDGQLAVAGWLAAGVAFDAIFAANDQSARGALIALNYAGRRVPEDVALIGFDDSAGSESLVPPLTTVRQSAFQLGWDAIVTLGRHALSSPLPDQIPVSTQFVQRESCGCPTLALADAADLHQQLAARLGASQGPIVQAAEVESWLAPLDQSLESLAAWARAFDDALALARARGWHTPALREYLPLWRARHRRADVAAFVLDRLLEYARDRLSHFQEIEYSRERMEREDRLNGLTYLMDLLRDCPRDQALEIALRHMVHSGAHGALVALQTADRNLAAQYVDSGVVQQHWSGALAAFPPAGWLAAGELLILMPLAGGSAQRGVIGVIEHAGRSQIDLDDLVLRSVNTYRATMVLNDTLRELEIARAVQRSLLPRTAPAYAPFEIAGASYPARQVGGDLYGYYRRPGGGLAVAVGDVVGKGMPAALLMSSCVTTLAGMINADLPPGRTLNQMHQVVQPYMGQGQIAGVCLAYLDGPRVTLANAGAIAPLLRDSADTRILDLGGLPLGTPLSSRAPYAELTLQLVPDDLLVLSTDGIVEAADAHGELYGFERFRSAIAAGPSSSAEMLLTHLFADVTAFVGEGETRDDMTIVVVRYRG
jgi:LacI family transcriptional regulator, galactose operon repressor